MTQFYQSQMPQVVVFPHMQVQQQPQLVQLQQQQAAYNQMLLQQQAVQQLHQQQQQQQQQQQLLTTQQVAPAHFINVPQHVVTKPQESTLPKKSKPMKKDLTNIDEKKVEKPFIPCSHNSWDNVRVSKKRMTLRCRICQKQWREMVDRIWGDLKCDAFTATSNCPKGDKCGLLHLHYRKLTLVERTKRGLVVAEEEPIPQLDHVESIIDEDDDLQSCPSLCEEEEEEDLSDCLQQIAEISSQAPTETDCFSARSHFQDSNPSMSMESLFQSLNLSPKGAGALL